MKILHTSDLHIGKRLYQAELIEDQLLFFHWLVEFIEKEKINVLMISGDVFDLANPSSESRKVYFELLLQLSRVKCKVIITGGNHDSPAMLEAPKELLKQLEIFVTGNLPEQISELLVPIYDEAGKPVVIIAAIPFLRDSDLRKRVENDSYEERTEAIKSGIINVFDEVAKSCEMIYPGIPAIAMGHLYVRGGIMSESEREIQVGNIAGIESNKLPGYFSYYALGHLHKPQEDQNISNLVYSGSPYPLSFSETGVEKRIVLLDFKGDKITIQNTPVPLIRRLIRLTGKVEDLKIKLKQLTPDPAHLKMLVELVAVEELYDPAKVIDLENLSNSFTNDWMEILKYRIQFNNQPIGIAGQYVSGTNIEELKPSDVFERKIQSEDIEDKTKKILLDAFQELLEEVEQMDEEEQS